MSAVATLSCSSIVAQADSGAAQASVRTTDETGGVGRKPFVDSRDPPAYRALDAGERARFDLGHAVFNTQWVPAGTPHAERRDGVGPLFNAASCDACHNEGARGRGPVGDGPAPPALVVKLSSPRAGSRGASGDPVYGRVLNTDALEGMAPEAEVSIRYETLPGRYPDGERFGLRRPRCQLRHLRYGPLAPDTIVEPRIAPAIFGDGLLEAVVGRPVASFGWQGTAVSVRDQTAQAFAREMGLTNPQIAQDDCTAHQRDCLASANGGSPEVSPALFDAVVYFERMLAVPAAPSHSQGRDTETGAHLFATVGCPACHTPVLTAAVPEPAGGRRLVQISPFTDLGLHDLGSDLADEDVSGHPVQSRWRTPPLWGLGYRLARERRPTFLHDGRARSVEEAILWHGGEASAARQRFEQLPREDRQALLAWVAAR